MSKKTVKLSVGAMQLIDENCFAAVRFAEGDSTKEKPKLEMIGYSGGIIKGHWYWGDLAIDLQGMAFPKKKFPILEDHNTSLKIGFAKKISTENNRLEVVDSEFVDTPESIKFRETSAQGFPYEASIYARPTQIQTLADNETAEVNGYTMKGPGTIWRKSTFKEVSVCTFGYDSNTKSAAMSESEELNIEYKEAVQLTNEEETHSMDMEKFKADYPELFAQVVADATATAEAKFAEEKSALETKLQEAQAQNTKLSAENGDLEKRTLKLEKAEALRQEASMKHSADSVFATKFAEAGLPERLSAKIRKMVSHEQFVADGVLDLEAFSAAVDAELKDWTDEEGDSSVQGFSTSTKTHGDDSAGKNAKVVDDTATRMKSYL